MPPESFQVGCIRIFFFVLVALSVLAPGLRAEEGGTIIRARFQRSIEALKGPCSSSTDPEKVVDALSKSRPVTFALEGVLKIYRKKYPVFGPFRLTLKRLEDRLGWYLDAVDHLKLAQGPLKMSREEFPNAYAVMEADLKRTRADLVNVLKADGWVPDPAEPNKVPILQLLESALTHTKWHTLEEDHEYVAKFIADHIQKKLIEGDYDMEDLEDGLHKERRELRWLLIYMQETGIVLDDREINPKWRKVLFSEDANGPYSKMPYLESQPYHLFVARAMYLEPTQAVRLLGDAKDVGEAEQLWLVRALSHNAEGVAGQGDIRDLRDAEAKAIELAKLLPNYRPSLATGEQVNRHVFFSTLLPDLRDNFKDQAKWSAKKCFRHWQKTVQLRHPIQEAE